MAFWRRARAPGALSLDEFVGSGQERQASPLELDPRSGEWQRRLASFSLRKEPASTSELALPAFTLIRGGDQFERARRRSASPQVLIDAYQDQKLFLKAPRIAREEREAAQAGGVYAL